MRRKDGQVPSRRHRNVPRAPRVQREVIVANRRTQADMLDHLARGRTKRRRDFPGSVVVHVAFTITPDLDQQIHDLAVKRDVSRSAVVRQALVHYFAEVVCDR